MTVELISVGTEILMGSITNTNAQYLAAQCVALGLDSYYQVTVGDNPKRLEETIRTALGRSDIIILGGGLGPTEDDLTKEITAKVMGRALYEDAHTRERIEDFFANGMHRQMPVNNLKQAMAPEGAIILDNDNGTAPGLILEDSGKRVILLPGPPNELLPMFEKQVRPYLEALSEHVFYSRTVKVGGMGESEAAERIRDLIDAQTNPTIATYAKTGEVHLRVTASAETKEAAMRLVRPVVREIRQRFGVHVFTTDEQVSMEEAFVRLLEQYQLTVTTAESCTGGMLGARLTSVPGVSALFKEGYITYSNEAKEKLLGVPKRTLRQYGAVSPQTAKAMAKGAAEAAGASAAISLTGIAGPDGGTDEKPVGLVYIGCCVNGFTEVMTCHFTGDRQKIRTLATARAMDFARRCVKRYGRM